MRRLRAAKTTPNRFNVSSLRWSAPVGGLGFVADVPLDSENPDESAEILKEMIRQVGEQGLEAHLRALGRYEAFVERLNARAAESAD